MIYHQLFAKFAPDQTVRAGIIGTGHYATAIVTQSADMPRLTVPIVADIDLDSARRAFQQAGLPDDQIVACDTRAQALQTIESGQAAIVQDAALLMDLPLDVIVEATGHAEAGARYASAAIAQGKHVAMVNKEADLTVGPILKRLADRAGVVYTAVDGDQHGLLIGMVSWARELGLEILCAAKFRDRGLILDASTGKLFHRGDRFPISEQARQWFQRMPPDQPREATEARLAAMGEAGEIDHFDYEELTIVANATGLGPDVPRLHHPALRTVEIPEVLCPLTDGGILETRGVIEMVSSLRHRDEASTGGGVFVVVSANSDYSRFILATKGCLSNGNRSAALIYRPYHLCGVETPMSILSAALLGLPTGATEYLPRYDVVAETTSEVQAGEALTYDDVRVWIQPAGAIDDGAPLPLHMALGNPLTRGLAAGTPIRLADVTPPADSALWSLRRQQDRLIGSSS